MRTEMLFIQVLVRGHPGPHNDETKIRLMNDPTTTPKKGFELNRKTEDEGHHACATQPPKVGYESNAELFRV